MRVWIAMFMTLLLGVATLSANAYRLAYKDQAGSVRNYRMTFQLSGSVSMMGMSVPMKGNMTTDAVEKVVAARAGEADLTTDFKNGKMHMVVSMPGGDGQDQTIDQPMPNYGLAYTRTPLGKMSNVRYTGDIGKTMSNQFGVLSGLQNSQGVVFPDHDVNIGDSWDSNQNLQMADGSRITVNMKYKLTGTKVVNGKTYLVIACDCSADIPSLTVNPQAPQGGAAAKPMTMGIKLNGTTSTLFDTAAGAYQETNMSMNVVITMAQQAGEDGEPMAMTMNMKMEGSMARTN